MNIMSSYGVMSVLALALSAAGLTALIVITRGLRSRVRALESGIDRVKADHEALRGDISESQQKSARLAASVQEIAVDQADLREDTKGAQQKAAQSAASAQEIAGALKLGLQAFQAEIDRAQKPAGPLRPVTGGARPPVHPAAPLTHEQIIAFPPPDPTDSLSRNKDLVRAVQRHSRASRPPVPSRSAWACPSCGSDDVISAKVFARKHPEKMRVKGGCGSSCLGCLLFIFLIAVLWPILLIMGVVGGVTGYLGISALTDFISKNQGLVIAGILVVIVIAVIVKFLQPKYICQRCGHKWR
jgi:hypothetical protein